MVWFGHDIGRHSEPAIRRRASLAHQYVALVALQLRETGRGLPFHANRALQQPAAACAAGARGAFVRRSQTLTKSGVQNPFGRRTVKVELTAFGLEGDFHSWARSRSGLLEEVVVVHIIVGIELVDDLLVDERQHIFTILPDLIGPQRPFGLAELVERPEVPGPQMLGAGQRAVGDHAGLFQRLFHVRTDRRNGAEAAAVVYNDELYAIDPEFLQRI